jgi:HEPN domain-containing protein
MHNNTLVQAFIHKAEHDFDTALIVQQHLPTHTDTIGFHCQQAIEKYLKAILVHLEINFAPKHDLIYLLNLIDTKLPVNDEKYNKLINIQQFAVLLRYPNEIIEPSTNEILDAINTTIFIRNWTMTILNLPTD